MTSPLLRPLAEADRLRRAYGATAVVTGASDGIGRAVAMRLAQAGFGLVLVARRKAVLDALADELEALQSIRPVVISADLSVPDDVARIDRDTAHLDVGLLVAAAGFGTSGPFVDGDLTAELNMIDVNCRALAQLTHMFGRRFAARRRGGIVLMSSLVAFQGVPRAANYAATKAFVQSLAEGLAPELKPFGVDVLASAPGPVMSGFGQRARMTIASGQTPDEVAVGTLKMLGRCTTVRPGFLAKALEASLMLLPRSGRAAMLARVMAGMTKTA
ncbi:putative oxidoreductase, short-chain dehydrogenase/reductase family [Bradyrhizobium sp. ORS 278]|uniref:SDR family NAD(P)-dependent oxidoreductase n=1 Tax=Bradyrhizobium sp. (strain ORS 278) TaxID=114615 RepID=UPI0001508F3F|nr:SDR family NAD(P)-dependent oxidoreductase [Bradyrhizobium sp. ORS 278]CAL77087.1 putative oxidoreductase, short-chain dehydrogenase/reductase family [Bradyrhizobium sp. ORS 278]